MTTSSPVFDLTGIYDVQRSYVTDLCGGDLELSDKVVALQNQLNTMNHDYQTAGVTTNNLLTDQYQVQNIVDTEYNRLLAKKQNIDDALIGQQRAVLLNESYRLRYVQYTKILILFITALVISFVAFQLKNSWLSFVPSFLFDFIIFLVWLAVVMLSYFIYSDIQRRDHINFNELSLPPPVINSSEDLAAKQNKAAQSGDLLGSIGAPCVGEACCDSSNNFWDPTLGKCTTTVIATADAIKMGFTTMSDAYTPLNVYQKKQSNMPLQNEPTEFTDYAPYGK
jgi:hypothetical protein